MSRLMVVGEGGAAESETSRDQPAEVALRRRPVVGWDCGSVVLCANGSVRGGSRALASITSQSFAGYHWPAFVRSRSQQTRTLERL